MTYIAREVEISLVPGVVSSFSYNAYEADQVWSNLAPGMVSLHEDVLQYNTKITLHEHRVYKEEIDELRHIYQHFWTLTTYNRKNWLSDIYRDPDNKLLGVNLTTFTPRDGLRRPEGTVLIAVEGVDIYTSVENLFSWIEHYRLLGKQYPIGGCENNRCVAYALYLEDLGIPRKYIEECFTLECMAEVENFLEVSMFAGLRPNEEYDSDDEDAAIIRNMGGLRLDSIQEAPEPAEEQVQEILHSVNIQWGDIDLEQLRVADEEDDFQSHHDDDARSIDSIEAYLLPYDRNLHASNNEFEALYNDLEKEDLEDEETWEASSDAHSEDLPDNKLSAIEELGIDLIDPSRDSHYQPEIRKVNYVWNPTGSRPYPTRFTLLRKPNG
jgi:hypothetical protein